MDSKVNIYIQRAKNELGLAEGIFKLSSDEVSKDNLGIAQDYTFYSAAISHAYYSIFYAANAIILLKEEKIRSPEIHKKTFERFRLLYVDTGILDLYLLKIYKKMIVRADSLLKIFKDEKWKRGHYTYQTIPQANIEPAKESIANAKDFLKHITKKKKKKCR